MDVKGKLTQKLSQAALGYDSLNRQGLIWHKSLNEAAQALSSSGIKGGKKKDNSK